MSITSATMSNSTRHACPNSPRATEICLPESITQHRDGRAARSVISGCNQPACRCIHAEGGEIVPTHEQALHVSNAAAPPHREWFRTAPRKHSREDLLLVADA